VRLLMTPDQPQTSVSLAPDPGPSEGIGFSSHAPEQSAHVRTLFGADMGQRAPGDTRDEIMCSERILIG